MNAVKRTFIAQHLLNKQNCAEKIYLDRFKVIKSCVNIFDLTKLKAICILNKTPNSLGKRNLIIALVYLLNVFLGFFYGVFSFVIN